MHYSPSDIKNEAGNSHSGAGTFEKLYVQLRKKEQRLYTDDEVRNLPRVAPAHPHFKEWLLRKKSYDRLIKYLNQKRKPLHILEVGCGNGWLSAQLAKNGLGQVIGMDINREELIQGERVFGDYPNLKFLPGDIRSCQLEQSSFDIILFAASLQYFSSLEEIMQSAFQYLGTGGEVHIMDTIFYQESNVDAARQRTKDYYISIGFPEASAYYFHHRIEELEEFKPEILYNPGSWLYKFTRNKSPFHWMRIKNSK